MYKLFSNIYSKISRYYVKKSNIIKIKSWTSNKSCNSFKSVTPLEKLDELSDKNITLFMTKKKIDTFHKKNDKKLSKFKKTKEKHHFDFYEKDSEYHSKEVIFVEKINLPCFKDAEYHYGLFSWKKIGNNDTHKFEYKLCVKICTSLKEFHLKHGKKVYKTHLTTQEIESLRVNDIFSTTNGPNILSSCVFNREIVLTDDEFMNLVIGNPKNKKDIMKMKKEEFDKVIDYYIKNNIYWLVDSKGTFYSSEELDSKKWEETGVSSLNKKYLSKSELKKLIDYKYATLTLEKYESELKLSELYLNKAFECEKIIKTHLKTYKKKNIIITINNEVITNPTSTQLGKHLLKNASTNGSFTITNLKTNKNYHYYYENDILMVKELGNIDVGKPAISKSSMHDETLVSDNDIV